VRLESSLMSHFDRGDPRDKAASKTAPVAGRLSNVFPTSTPVCLVMDRPAYVDRVPYGLSGYILGIDLSRMSGDIYPLLCFLSEQRRFAGRLLLCEAPTDVKWPEGSGIYRGMGLLCLGFMRVGFACHAASANG
jgi:hypothetical protein